MQTINAQTIINQVQALAITAPDEREDYVTPTSTPLAYVKIKTSDRGYAHIINDKKRLYAFASKVRKNAAAFGGGLIKTPKTLLAWASTTLATRRTLAAKVRLLKLTQPVPLPA